MLLTGLTTGCTATDQEPLRISLDSTDTRTQRLADLIAEHEQLDRFAALLEATGQLQSLRESSVYTVFAPDDDAIDRALPPDSLVSALPGDSLARLLDFHMVRGRLTPARLHSVQQVSTLANAPLTLAAGDTGVALRVNEQTVRETIEAQNGILYVIESVLNLPPPDSSRQSAAPPP